MASMITRTRNLYQGDERILFINAWNEWAEGCHLEPDAKWGSAYLEATLRALSIVESNEAAPSVIAEMPPSYFRSVFWRVSQSVREFKNVVKQLSCPGRYTDL
jgi:hypothetical protein